MAATDKVFELTAMHLLSRATYSDILTDNQRRSS